MTDFGIYHGGVCELDRAGANGLKFVNSQSNSRWMEKQERTSAPYFRDSLLHA